MTEFIQAVMTLGLNLFAYYDFWARQSGVHGEPAVSSEREMLCSMQAVAIR